MNIRATDTDVLYEVKIEKTFGMESTTFNLDMVDPEVRSMEFFNGEYHAPESKILEILHWWDCECNAYNNGDGSWFSLNDYDPGTEFDLLVDASDGKTWWEKEY